MPYLQRVLALAVATLGVCAVPACGQTIDSIEINQSIGKLYDGTANTNFVAGKATVVRAFMSAEVMVDEARTSALIMRNGQNVITIPPKNYSLPTRVIDFLCPSLDACGRWAAGSYQFQIVVNGGPPKSTAGTTYNFQTRQTLRILARPVKALFSGTAVSVPNDSWNMNWTFTRASYPIADDAITWDARDELDATNLPNLPIDMNTETGRTNLWQALKNLQPPECTMNPKGPGCYDLIVGFIGQNPRGDDGSMLAGYTLTGPSDLSSTVVTVATDPDANATVAHEIAHTRQLGDTYAGGAINCTLNPSPDGVSGMDFITRQPAACTAGRMLANNIDMAGNNINGTLVPQTVNPYNVSGTGPLPNKADFMAAGNGSATSSFWITPDSYTRLFTQLVPTAPAQAARAIRRAGGTQVQAVRFSGLVTAAGLVTLQPWQTFLSADPIVTHTGNYSIRAVDATGAILATQGFNVSFSVLTNPPTTVKSAPFGGVILFPENTAKFQIVNGATVLKELAVSHSDPVVAQVTPGPGLTISGQSTISWLASDADGQPLTYNVEYTPDATDPDPTWELIGQNLTVPFYTYDFAGLPGGQHAAILVTATDGIRSGSGQSAEFVVPFKRAKVVIDNEPNSNYEVDDEIELSGAAVDLQDGIVADAGLVWSSNISGKLGAGGTLEVALPAGAHIITLTATNHAGLSSSSSVVIRVGSLATGFSEDPAKNPIVATSNFESLIASAALPAGALAHPAAVIMEVTASPVNATPPPGFTFAGRNFNLTIEQESAPDEFTPVASIPQGVNITLAYKAAVNPATVRLFRWSNTSKSWVDAATECQPASMYNRSAGQIVVKVCATGSFALAAPSELAIANYQLVANQSAAGMQSALTYRADLVNPGGALGSVSATLTSLDPFSLRVQPGQGVLNFAPVPAGGQVRSSNTFTVLTDGSVPLDFSKLKWTFQTTAAAPVASAGSNQTVKLGNVATLDGSGSTNPSGMGTLTYNWTFTSRPPGTTARLLYSTSPIATFVADVSGTYIVMLTVSNGAASNSTLVSITATP